MTSSKSQRTRTKLLQALLAEIETNGTFTAESIAQRTDTSVATFYGHFSSKESALAAGFSLTLDTVVAVAEHAWQVERLLDMGLETLCREGVRECVSCFQSHALVFRTALAELPQSKLIRQIYRDHEAHALASYERFIRLGQRAGIIRGQTADIQTIARAHLVLTQGLNNPHLTSGTGDAQAEDLLDVMASAIAVNLAGPGAVTGLADA